MEENTHQQSSHQQTPHQQAPQRSMCPGDCTGCNIYQRNFCSSQLGHTNMKLITALLQEVVGLKAEVKGMSSLLAASHQQSEALINPTKD